MNKTLRTRVASITGSPPAPDKAIVPPGSQERVMVMCAGEVNLQIPLEYIECVEGSVAYGDIFEVTIRKIPALGRRIGEESLATV